MRNLAATAALGLALSGLLLAVPALAGTVAGVTMPDTTKAGDQQLVLNGMALRSKMMFKVYVGGLYLPAKTSDWKGTLAADNPRHFVMHWLRSVEKAKINEAWHEGLAANTPNASAELKKQFDTLSGWMEDSRTGDTFLFTYLPGKGTTVTVAGKTKGTIPGKEFADALFACWIGANPGPGVEFRQALMGG